MKATVLHIIESLAIGGAEVLLTESLKDITDEYRHILVYMRPITTLLPEVKADNIYCLNYKGKRSFLWSILQLRRIIKKENVNLIHAHHYWPTVLARFAKPPFVSLLFSVHNPLSKDAFSLNRLSYYLEKFTYRSSQHAIFVSEAVKKDYNKTIRIKGSASVLYNFVADKFYIEKNAKNQPGENNALNIVAVGTLKRQKNYHFLLKAIALLKDREVYLDIMGEGPLMQELECIKEANALRNVRLLGKCNNMHELLHKYDIFMLSSTYEGMSLAVIEAMAVGLPCILSDIEPNREVTGGHAIFFDLSSPEDCVTRITELAENAELRNKLSIAGRGRAKVFHKHKYLSQLEALYKQYLP
ncbi:glycosyltransferase [Pontibacter sp. H249]|uniref:glycosyltransferase n=1 Tax=Pontibacter sp. H249 TaxID=3133420 RepID=UPI0030BA2D6B